MGKMFYLLVLVFSFTFGCIKKGPERNGSNSILTSVDYDVTLIEGFGELHASLKCQGDVEIPEAKVDTSSSSSLKIIFKPKSKLDDGLECSCKIYSKDLSDLTALKAKYDFAFSTDEKVVLLASDIKKVSGNSLLDLVFLETYSEKITSSEDVMEMSLSLKVEQDMSFESFTLECGENTQVITKSLDFSADTAATLKANVKLNTAISDECKINGLKGNEIYSNNNIKFQKTDDGKIEGMETYLLSLQTSGNGSGGVVVSGEVDENCDKNDIVINDDGSVFCKQESTDKELITRLEEIGNSNEPIYLKDQLDDGKKIMVLLSNGKITVEKDSESNPVSYEFLTKNHKIVGLAKTEHDNYDQYVFDLNGWDVKIRTSKFEDSNTEKKLESIIFRKSANDEFTFLPFTPEVRPVIEPEFEDALSKMKKELSDNFGMVDDKVQLREKTGRGVIELVFDGTKLSIKKISGEDFAFLAEGLDADLAKESILSGETNLILRDLGEEYSLVHKIGNSTVKFKKDLDVIVFKALKD